jgi:hypothetical protein
LFDVTQEKAMIKNTKLALIAAIAAVSIASPAFAQAFTPRDGTGNVLPFSYGPGGARVYLGDPPASQNRTALYNFVPTDPRAGASIIPGATGSSGYNALLLQH